MKLAAPAVVGAAVLVKIAGGSGGPLRIIARLP